MGFTFAEIGKIESVFKEKFGTPRQSGLVPASRAMIRLEPSLNLSEALFGLEEFSYVWILFVFHKNANKSFNSKIYPPRMGGDKIGLFATRSPHRFNPIGLSCAKIEKIDGNDIYVSGIDLIEGTPILDLKPYVPEVDSRPNAKRGWLERARPSYLEVEMSTEALADLQTYDPDKKLCLHEMIMDILSQDPRNPMDKELSREGKQLGFFLDDFNVIFSVKNSLATVLKVEPAENFHS